MKTLFSVVLMLAALLLSGCGGGEARGRPRYFSLDPGQPASLKGLRAGMSKATASVSYANVASPFSGEGFVYQTGAHRWEVDPYNQFLVPPADLMTSTLRNWLRASALFGGVAETGMGVAPDYTIYVNVTEIYGDFRNPSQPLAVMSLDMEVFQQTAEGRMLVLRRGFSRSVPLKDRSPGALVAAWNEALEGNLSEFLRALADAGR